VKINGYQHTGSSQIIMVDPIEAEYVGQPAGAEWVPVWVNIQVMPPLTDDPAADDETTTPLEESGQTA
jgi:hypothetical protein